jgi:hypothetical protein
MTGTITIVQEAYTSTGTWLFSLTVVHNGFGIADFGHYVCLFRSEDADRSSVIFRRGFELWTR